MINYSYRAWTNNIYCNWCWFWCNFNTAGSPSCNMSKVCKNIMFLSILQPTTFVTFCFCPWFSSVQHSCKCFQIDLVVCLIDCNTFYLACERIRIPNNNKIRPIKILSIHCSRYLAYPFASQIKCITINKTNDQVDLKTFTRM
jgi:hypothetical protein